MTKLSEWLTLVCVSFTCILLSGCQIWRGPDSPYVKYYGSFPQNLQLPSSKTIFTQARASNLACSISKPVNVVWDAALQAACQSEGVLAARRDSQDARLMIISGEQVQLKAPGFTGNANTTFIR